MRLSISRRPAPMTAGFASIESAIARWSARRCRRLRSFALALTLEVEQNAAGAGVEPSGTSNDSPACAGRDVNLGRADERC